MKIALLLTAVSFCLILHGQSPSSSNEFYLITLKRYVPQMDSLNLNEGIVNESIYIEKADFFDTLPQRINGYKIIVMNEENWRNIYHKNNNSIIHHKLKPLEILDDKAVVTITLYHGKLKGKDNLMLALSDWIKVFFNYNCAENSWEFESIRNGGI